tara:strand:+ start:67 stop:318 length:252 start_codon:yes stop_codon:yes gene_type:complete
VRITVVALETTHARELVFPDQRSGAVYTIAATKEFIRGHCGKVANKASTGRVIDASAKAAVHLQEPHSPTELSILAGDCLRFN